MASWSRRRRRQNVGDVARVIREALRGLVRGRVALGTVTAPGGTFDTLEAAAWNVGAAGEWRKLRDRIKREMLRRHGLRPPVVLVRVAQRQARGLDHLHLCWWLHGPEHELRIRTWVALYREYATDYGFGFVDDPFHVRRLRNGRMSNMVFEDAATAGYYLGNYLAGGQLERLMAAEDRSWSPVWISPALRARTGWSLGRCQWIRQAWHIAHGSWASVTWYGSPRYPAWFEDDELRAWVCRHTGWNGQPGSGVWRAPGIPARGPRPAAVAV